MRIVATVAMAALSLASALASAESARVEAVQYPAWLERGGNSVPLTPGTRLEASDKLRTGANARVLLQLPEGSSVKLGENAQFVIQKAEDQGIFRAALQVITGAFRFTTDALHKGRRRDISIQVRNVTAGIRGTDLWGKSTDQRDLVCLLEGKISVGAEDHPSVTLDEPGAFYQKPRDGEPAVAKVDQKQIEIWSQETEIQKDGAAARVGGKWKVVVAKLYTRDEALQLNRRVRASGYPSEIGTSSGHPAVIVGGLAGEAQARALMANLRTIPGVEGPTVQSP